MVLTMFKANDLRDVSQVLFTGQRVTVEREPFGWLVTGWEDGLPVARKPMTETELLQLMNRRPEIVTLRY